jgi:DNA repair exonuclease SbcCD ATPase subunit
LNPEPSNNGKDRIGKDRFETAAVRLLNDQLPIPVRDRWQPLRIGLMNLFLFEDERFPFADGRLLLRGSNGTGKSRVLAMTLPLLLDGSFKATRVEPDRDSNRQVAWNLLMDDQSSATGYSWLEFGRIDENGVELFLTIGCGMKAKRGQAIKPWFFITEHRIDDSLCLMSADSVPLTRKQLGEAIEGRGQVYETATEYRRGVDEALFRLGERYDPLIDLLLQLRQPQLAKKLNIDQLELALRESLPPLPESLLDDAAEAFRDLDHYRKSLETDRQTLKNVERFLRPYRDHLSRGVKRSLRSLTSANSRYETAQRDLRRLTTQQEEQKKQLDKTENQQSDLKIKITAGRTAISELQSSPEMQQADKLDSETSRAKRLEEREAEEREAVDAAINELKTAKQDIATTEKQLESKRESTVTESQACRSHAAPEELQNKHNEAVTALLQPDDVQRIDASQFAAAKRKAISVAKRFQKSASHLIEANKKLNAIAEQHRSAKQEVTRSEQARAERDEALTLAKQNFKQARIDGWANVLSWIENANVLLQPFMPQPESWHDNWHSWSCESRDSDPSRALVDQARLAVIDDLTVKREAWNQQVKTIDESVTRLRVEKEERLAGRLAAPPLRAHRVATGGLESVAGVAKTSVTPNSGESGYGQGSQSGQNERDPNLQSFWDLVDFKNSVPDAERGNWEAALHDAGVLDASLTADGKLVSFAHGNETQIIADDQPALEPDRQLACVLKPAIEASGARSDQFVTALSRVLSVIGVGENAGSIWVTKDGCWRNGPLFGQLTKSQPQYIGEAARQRWRENRIQEIEAETNSLRTQQNQLTANLSQAEQTRLQIEALIASFPSSEPIVDANKAESTARQSLDSASELLRQSNQKETDARKSLDEATDHRNADATDMGLIAWADRADELHSRIEGYLSKLETLDAKVDAMLVVLSQMKTNQATLDQATRRKEKAEKRLHQTRTDLASAEETVKVLQASVGKSVAEMMTRLETAREEQNQRESKADQLAEAFANTKANLAVVASELSRSETDSKTYDEERREATNWFSMLHENGLLELVIEPTEIPELPWTMTGAIKLARSVDSQLKKVPADPDSWQRSQSSVHKAQNELRQTVFSQDGMSVELEHFRDGLQVVNLTLQGERMSPVSAVARLETDIQNREQILDAREQDTLEKYLLGEVAEGLRNGMRMASELVAVMTSEVSKRPMKTGMQMRFKWRRDDEGPVGLKEACEVLETDSSTWSASERDQIKKFLQRSIREQRESEQVGTWHQHIRAALDYRLWHRIIIERRSGPEATWQKLTRRTYGSGSGGEKAIALTLPQLAAAAAYYRSADKLAPRFILLDEAFAGISSDMRESCMELISAFKLDVVMTSESEWGMYAGVKQLAICQLDRFADINAVVNRVFIWNGTELRQSVSQEDAQEVASQPLFPQE